MTEQGLSSDSAFVADPEPHLTSLSLGSLIRKMEVMTTSSKNCSEFQKS